ncbi:MAG: hypothetical protein H0X69_10280 [Gemmatimonadales bacterium]|nr:hypothetical protein [Gemmatimonadales bacterium]
MFSKISRYRNIPDVAVRDAKGRVLASKSLRLLPEVAGTFLHRVEEVDRLDHLAFKYYEQPRDWWRIADANPDYLSPQALLGHEPRSTLLLPLVWDGSMPPWSELEGATPPWSELLEALRRALGVEGALLGPPEQPEASVEVVQGRPLFTLLPTLRGELDDSVRTQEVMPALGGALAAEGVSFTIPVRAGEVRRKEVRPEKVDAVTWRITALETRRIYTFRHFPGEALLQVYESAFRYHWILKVIYNTQMTSAAALQVQIQERGFATRQPTEVRRIGKPVVMPPRT